MKYLKKQNLMFGAWLSKLSSLKNSASLRGQIVRGALGSILIKVGNAIVGLGITVVLARLLGPEEFGYYSFALSIVALLIIPVQLGLPTLIVREVAISTEKTKWAYINSLIWLSDRVVVSLALVFTLFAAVTGYLFAETIDSLDFGVFLLALGLLPVLALVAVRGAAIRGLGLVVSGQIPELILRQSVFFILLITALIVGFTDLLSPHLVMGLHLLAACISLFFASIKLNSLRSVEPRKTLKMTEIRHFFRSALPFALLAGIQVINNHSDIVILGLFTTAEDVGVYKVALQGATLVAFTLSAINMVLAPRITTLYKSGDMVRIQKLVTWGARVVTLTALPLTLIFVFAGEAVLIILFGNKFAVGYMALAILSIAQFVTALVGSVGLLLTMTGYERDAAIGVSYAAVINVILNLILIPLYGIEGAAFATFTSLVFWNFYLYFGVRRRLGLSTTIFSATRKV